MYTQNIVDKKGNKLMRQTAYFNIRYYLIPILILCVVLSTFWQSARHPVFQANNEHCFFGVFAWMVNYSAS